MDDNLSRDKMDAGMGDGERRGGFKGKGGKVFYKKKIDKIKAHNLTIDYKHPEVLKRFMNEARALRSAGAVLERHAARAGLATTIASTAQAAAETRVDGYNPRRHGTTFDRAAFFLRASDPFPAAVCGEAGYAAGCVFVGTR